MVKFQQHLFRVVIMPKMKICPRCEINYIPLDKEYCSICESELKGIKAENEENLCPKCGVNYLEDGEKICSECAEKRKRKYKKRKMNFCSMKTMKKI